MDDSKSEQTRATDWIKKVQARSWEIELFISGGSLFALMQISETVMGFLTKLMRVNDIAGMSTTTFAIVIPTLVGCFALHLAVRGFWVALVILYRVYPSGIVTERLKLSERFMKPVQKFDLKESINRLDKVCSLLFSASFVYAILLFGLCALIAIVMGIMFSDFAQSEWMQKKWLMAVYYVVVSVLMIAYLLFLYVDLPTSGFLRRGKWIPKIWYPFYQLFNFLTLGFLWRPYLQVITTNINNRLLVFVWFVLFYLIGFAFLFSSESNNTKLIESLDATIALATPNRESHYQDKNQPDTWTDLTIQSDVITDGYLKIFVPADKLQKKWEPIESSPTISILVNDSLCVTKWVGIVRMNGQRGLTTVLDIQHLKNDLHAVTIMAPADTTKIQFWKH